MKVRELSRVIRGKPFGNLELDISSVSSPETAGERDLIFILDKKMIANLPARTIGCVISRDKPPDNLKVESYILVDNPKTAMVDILSLFIEEKIIEKGISDRAYVKGSVRFGRDITVMPFSFIGAETIVDDDTVIYPFVYIGEKVKIGKGCKIYPFVHIESRTEIGDRVILHPGVVVGSDGFGYVKTEEEIRKIPQIGNVIIEDDCEIGANSCLDRATMGTTRIKRGTKIDNLVQIAHNVEIGEDTLIAAQVGIAGSSKVGKEVMLAGQVGIADHLKIGDYAIVTAQSGISSDVPPHSVYSGYYARDRTLLLKAQSLFYRLPELFERLRKLENRIYSEENTEGSHNTQR